jgi:hypothetical protein
VGITTTLARSPAARVVYQNLAHALSYDRSEVRAVLELLCVAGETEIHFVDELGGLKGMVRTLAPQVCRG